MAAAPDGRCGGKIPTTSVVGPDLPRDLFRETAERQQVRAGCVEVVSDLRELLRQGVDVPIILCVNRLGVRLVVDEKPRLSRESPMLLSIVRQAARLRMPAERDRDGHWGTSAPHCSGSYGGREQWGSLTAAKRQQQRKR